MLTDTNHRVTDLKVADTTVRNSTGTGITVLDPQLHIQHYTN